MFSKLIEKYPQLQVCQSDIEASYLNIKECFEQGNKLLVCGNGGSAADAQHFVGELAKSFGKKREAKPEITASLKDIFGYQGILLSKELEGGLPAIALGANTALSTAIINDVNADVVFAQEILALGKANDILIGLSTSGNSTNVVKALMTAKAIGMKTVALTGESGGEMKDIADISICVPASYTPEVQELHLPVYHAISEQIENYFF